ncbi:Nuclear cap-binding protein subunit 1 [Camellia lanceoleosa]|uniref:Nuclear cap-binding protein subunit 1 n=1 Tax=Camellia lanceoleosa TaxID=1840588 RepID=A0ACC0H571_9ERIC|nr:Nuclear cap-binding protein subunit 1 [Camellia lanceoleosa]
MSSWKSLLLRIGENCPEYGGIIDFKDHIETCSEPIYILHEFVLISKDWTVNNLCFPDSTVPRFSFLNFCHYNFLEDLWGRIQDLSSNGWKLESVPRPHLSFEAQLVAGKAHDLEPINCPEQPDPPAVLSAITCGKQKQEAELKYPQRIRRLNIFPANKTELLLLPHPPFKPMYYTLVIIDLCKSIENAPALEELLPPKGVPNFKYSGDGTEHALSVELSGMVKARQTIREVISWMEENVMPAHGFEITLSVIVQTLLDIGSKSFTHLITVLEPYGQVIARICTDQDKQVMLIAEVSSYWKNSAQMTAIAIDQMMGYLLISNLAIVRWVFSPANIEQFCTTDHPWEILRNAVNMTYNRISDLRKEISVLKNSVVSAEEAATKAKAELEGAESKLTLVDGEPLLGENPGKAKRAQVITHDAFRDGTLCQSHQADEMAIDLEDSSAIELDKENGKSKKSHSNGEWANGYNVGEKEQWCLSTLGYVKAFSRQYASEIWPHIEKLDAEVFTENVHPLFRKAVYSGLNRPLNDLGSGQ